MDQLGQFCCHSCNMAFRSCGLLEKHKARFCIGSNISDPEALRRGISEKISQKGLYPKKAKTSDFVHIRERQRRTGDRVGETGPRSLGDEQHGSHAPESAGLSNLTREFQKLRMSIEESLSSLPKQRPKSREGQAAGRVWVDEEKIQEVAAKHEQQLAEIRAHNKLLEQQKEEIQRQLAELAGQGNTTQVEVLLQELREQEERNKEVLNQLSAQISSIQGAREPDVRSESPENRKPQHVNFDLITPVDGPISVQIRSLRMAYMQAGGADPEVLAQMHDLQAEAQSLEQARPRADHKSRKRCGKPQQQGVMQGLLDVEEENQRLSEEIFRIQLVRDRQRGGDDFHLIQRDHLHHMASLQAEISSLRREVERARDRRPPPPPPPPLFSGSFLSQAHPALQEQTQHNAISGRHVMDHIDTLGPAPYDPATGFVIFYDLVLGVEASLRVVRLVAGLYMGGQEMGSAIPMPSVQCQPAGSLSYLHPMAPGNYAILSVKQPVPRMQPSPGLCLVVEVQAAGGLDSLGQEIQRLLPRGWARLDLFDQHNQVRSGFWRVPFRALPVRPSLSPSQLNAVPQLGKMELCLRVVNARDGDVQSLAKIEPNTTSHYKYPPMVAAHMATIWGNPSPPPQTNHTDPPLHEEGNQN